MKAPYKIFSIKQDEFNEDQLFIKMQRTKKDAQETFFATLNIILQANDSFDIAVISYIKKHNPEMLI